MTVTSSYRIELILVIMEVELALFRVLYQGIDTTTTTIGINLTLAHGANTTQHTDVALGEGGGGGGRGGRGGGKGLNRMARKPV